MINIKEKIDIIVCAKKEPELERVLNQIISLPIMNNLIIIAGDRKTEKIGKKYTNLVYYDERKGIGYARKLGVEKSATKIICFVDGDVILTPNCIEKMLRHFKNEKVVAVTPICLYGYGSPLADYWKKNVMNLGTIWGCQCTLFRRDKILELGNFDETLTKTGEDYDLWIRIQKEGYHWVFEKRVEIFHPMTEEEFKLRQKEWEEGLNIVKNKYKPIS